MTTKSTVKLMEDNDIYGGESHKTITMKVQYMHTTLWATLLSLCCSTIA